MKKGKKNLLRMLLCAVMTCMLMTGCLMSAYAAGDGIAFDLSASVTGDDAESINPLLSTAGINITAGTEGENLRLSVKASALGMDLVRSLLEITSDKIAFAFPDIDQSRYEYSTDKLMELIQESPYGQILQGAYGGNQLQGPQIDPEAYIEVLTPYANYLGSFILKRVQIEENAVIAMERLGKEANGSIATLEPTAEDLAELFGTLADMIEQDEALAGIVEQWALSLENIDPATLSAINSILTPELEPEAAAQEIRSAFSQLPENLRETSRMLSENGMQGIVIRLTAAFDESMPLKVSFYIENTEISEYYEFGFEDAPSETGADLILYMENQDEKYGLRVNGTNTTGTISVLVNSTPAAVLTYAFDPAKRSYLGMPSGTCVLNVMGLNIMLIISEGTEEGGDYILQFNGLENVYYSTDVTGLTVKLHIGPSEVPEAPSGTTVDISDYGPEELAQLFQKLANAMADKLAIIFG